MASRSHPGRAAAAASDDSGKSESVSALERGFRVLDCFVAAARPLGNSEVADLTGIPRPSVTRLIATLVGLGHLRPVESSERWELAAGVVRLAQAFLGTLNIRDYARAHLQRLAEELGSSSFLGVRDGLEVLVVEAARPRAAVAVMSADVGTRMSLAHSALGRAWLLGVTPQMRDMVLRQLADAAVVPGGKKAELLQSLEGARAGGYIVSLGEWHPAIYAAAVPVRTADGQVVTLNSGGPAFMLPEETLRERVVPALLAAAQALARDIGGLAGPALTRLHEVDAQAGVRVPEVSTSKPRGRGRSTKETDRNGSRKHA